MVTRHRSPSRHRMRRNARRLRRYGIEPMAIVTDDLDLGSVVAAVITRGCGATAPNSLPSPAP